MPPKYGVGDLIQREGYTSILVSTKTAATWSRRRPTGGKANRESVGRYNQWVLIKFSTRFCETAHGSYCHCLFSVSVPDGLLSKLLSGEKPEQRTPDVYIRHRKLILTILFVSVVFGSVLS